MVLSTHNVTGNDDIYSIFTPNQKLAIVLVASVAAFISPASAYVYLPAMAAMGEELGASPSRMNWSITTYIVCYRKSALLLLRKTIKPETTQRSFKALLPRL
jgi:hypothetical protein